MAVVADLGLPRRRMLERKLARTARELATACLTAELAAERDDWDTMHDAVDDALVLANRLREQRRGLLVAGRHSR